MVEDRPKRVLVTMPADIRIKLAERKLTTAYRERPQVQRNDYLEWIAGAKLSILRNRRISQMLDELQRGDVYMNEIWRKERKSGTNRL